MYSFSLNFLYFLGRDLEGSSGPINAVLKEKLDTCGIAIAEVASLGPYTVKVSWTVSTKLVVGIAGLVVW